jgi:hypothetical protein
MVLPLPDGSWISMVLPLPKKNRSGITKFGITKIDQP